MSLSQAIQFARRRMDAGDPWIWTVEIAASIPGEFYRLCTGSLPVAVNGLKYQAGVSSLDVPPESEDPSEGIISLPWHPAVMQVVDSEGELNGQDVRYQLVFYGDAPEVAKTYVQRVLDVAVDPAEGVAIKTGNAAELEMVPRLIYTRVDNPGLLTGQGSR